jgi:hypothetical protein
MKKLLLTTAFLALGIVGVFAQGTVNFNNTATLFADSATVDRFIYDSQGAKLTGTNWVAELWFKAGGGQTADSLTEIAVGTGSSVVGAGGARFRVPTTTLPGTWAGGNRTLGGVPIGDTATLQVRVWDINAFATYALAVRDGGVYGNSDTFNYTVPPSGSLPAEYTLKGLRTFSLVPEPSAIALGALGLGALVVFRRRKN